MRLDMPTRRRSAPIGLNFQIIGTCRSPVSDGRVINTAYRSSLSSMKIACIISLWWEHIHSRQRPFSQPRNVKSRPRGHHNPMDCCPLAANVRCFCEGLCVLAQFGMRLLYILFVTETRWDYPIRREHKEGSQLDSNRSR